MALSQVEVWAILEPHSDRLWHSAVKHGFERYKTYPHRPLHRRETRASVIHDLMVDGARQEFDGISGVRFIDVARKGLTLVEIEETVLIWFKKLGVGRLPRANRTRHAALLMCGRLDLLPGLPPAATLVVVGYKLNLDETRVSRVSIARFAGRPKPEWYIDLEEPEEGVRAIPETPPHISPSVRRVRARPGAVQSKLLCER